MKVVCQNTPSHTHMHTYINTQPENKTKTTNRGVLEELHFGRRDGPGRGHAPAVRALSTGHSSVSSGRHVVVWRRPDMTKEPASQPASHTDSHSYIHPSLHPTPSKRPLTLRGGLDGPAMAWSYGGGCMPKLLLLQRRLCATP